MLSLQLCAATISHGRRQISSSRNLFGGAWVKKLRERRAQKTKQLKADLDKSYVSELREYKSNQGKRFHAEDRLLPKEQTIQFPSVSGCSLSDVTVNLPLAQTSLVLVSMKGLGMRACNQYRKPVEEELDGKVAIVELSLLEKGVLVLLHRWIRRNLRKTIPSSRHDTFLFYSGDVASKLRDALKIHSSIVGHAYLLDKEGYIRWRAHATPTQNELQILIKCAKKLLSE